jgi:hypothetical protein
MNMSMKKQELFFVAPNVMGMQDTPKESFGITLPVFSFQYYIFR